MILILSLFGCNQNGASLVTVTPKFQQELASRQAPTSYQDLEGTAIHKFQQQLALRWAPILHQDVDVYGEASLNGKADYICKLDFDGDWEMRNNWENAIKFSQVSYKAYSYYSIVTTSTHWFILYAFFHPRDWSNIPIVGVFDMHENDMEGVLTIVKRPQHSRADPYGEVLAVITAFHRNFYSFVPIASPLQENHEAVGGVLTLQEYRGELHPIIGQEARGHGIKAWPFVGIRGRNGLIYYPSGSKAEEPDHPNDRNVSYKLINIFEKDGLWDRRNRLDTFSSWGFFAGDKDEIGALAPENVARPPWGWDDKNDDYSQTSGEIATDPIKLAKHYFVGFSTLSEAYLVNQYQRSLD